MEDDEDIIDDDDIAEDDDEDDIEELELLESAKLSGTDATTVASPTTSDKDFFIGKTGKR